MAPEQRDRQVFIIGAARSGTKFLRDSLAVDDAFATVPYDVNYIWRTGNEGESSDVLPPPSAAIARRVKKGLLDASGRIGGQTLLEKSVSNCLRVPFVDAVFPHALFVHLVRNGEDVVESSYRQWTAPTDRRYLVGKIRSFPWRNYRYAAWFAANQLKSSARRTTPVWGPRYPGIEDDVDQNGPLFACARQWVECLSQARSDLDSISRDRWIEIDYESLCSDRETIETVARFCRAEDPRAVGERWESSLAPPTQRGWSTRFDDEQRALVTSVIASVGDIKR